MLRDLNVQNAVKEQLGNLPVEGTDGRRGLILKTVNEIKLGPDLQVPPVIEFQDQRAVADTEWCGIVVVSIHKKQVRGRAISPLKTCIHIDVLLLFVVLNKSCQK